MKKLCLVLVLLVMSSGALAWGQLTRIGCSYGYNSDYGKSGYTGTYKHPSGNIYRYFFPSPQYSYCPFSVDL